MPQVKRRPASITVVATWLVATPALTVVTAGAPPAVTFSALGTRAWITNQMATAESTPVTIRP